MKKTAGTIAAIALGFTALAASAFGGNAGKPQTFTPTEKAGMLAFDKKLVLCLVLADLNVRAGINSGDYPTEKDAKRVLNSHIAFCEKATGKSAKDVYAFNERLLKKYGSQQELSRLSANTFKDNTLKTPNP